MVEVQTGDRSIFSKIRALESPFVILEDRLTPNAGGQIYLDLKATVHCNNTADVEAAFRQIDEGLASGLHAAGLLSYELGYAFEPRLTPKIPANRDQPLLWFGLFGPPKTVNAEELDAFFASLSPPPPITDLHGRHDRPAHTAKVKRILRLISEGDVYQVNLTFPYDFQYSGDPLSLYAALRARQPVSHGGMVFLADTSVLSVSPELWVKVEAGQATTRPMKGTAARGVDAAADLAARNALLSDPKQRAENLMIVDLLRNDLSRVTEPGTVRVPELFTVETYPSFHALTSTITGRLDRHGTLRDRVAALFPCGSIVGAPKIRAGEIIRSIEASPRGFYTGALGAFSPNGDMAFNVAIRTAVLKSDGPGRYDVGGGVVADSDPDAEYDEACLKARVLTDLTEDYGLIETFRWSSKLGFVRLDLHLRRLERSAFQLGFTFDRLDAERRLSQLLIQWTSNTSDKRVRLQLNRAGVLEITCSDAAKSKKGLKVGMAKAWVDAGDPFLRHKTTHRAFYDLAFTEAAAKGLDEVIFLNQRGEIAEASRHSVFIEISGRLFTPALNSGVLPGVLREQLLCRGRATEWILHAEMLSKYPVRLGNSLNGLRQASFMNP